MFAFFLFKGQFNRYPCLSRTPRNTFRPMLIRACRRAFSTFATLNPADLSYFREILPAAAVVTDAEMLEAYNRDWMRKYKGSSTLVLRPETTGVSSVF